MFKRILAIGGGVAFGLALALGAARVSLAWGWWGHRDLDRSTDYVREVLQLVNENYVDGPPADYDKLTRSALHGMIDSLDPHSEFMESDNYREMEEEMSGKFGGIGIQVEIRSGHVIVIAPIADTPGERAGILRGDEIMRVDDKPVEKGSTMNSVVDRLRGLPNTKVRVTLFRPGTGKTFELTLVREVIKVDSVRDVHVLPGGVGYLQLTEFSEHTGVEFGLALERLVHDGATSLVLDLRNNPGGLLEAAVDVAQPFFRKGELIVYTQGRKTDDRDDYRSEAKGEPLRLPLAVIINAGSASAAEIVAGALKDTGRAVIVGERSFGKGSVQSIFKLKNGEGLRLTTARYYTPSGVSIHEKGIEPQVTVVMTPDEDSKLRLQRARSDVTAPREFEERFAFAPIEDRQLQAAVDVLKGVRALGTRAGGPVAR
ncbi:MAG TPA: S41 family peptidase [Opitutaceae bacterium]|nr:S41 family peptidase [Opitutaceae bacterium]